MKKLETAGFTALSNDELKNLDGGGTVTDLLNTIEGILNPIGAQLDTLLSGLPLPSLPGLGGLGSLTGLLGGLGI